MKISDVLVEAEEAKKKKAKKVTLTARQQEKKAALNAEGKRYHKPKRKGSSSSVKPTAPKETTKEKIVTLTKVVDTDTQNSGVYNAMDEAFNILSSIDDVVDVVTSEVTPIGQSGRFNKFTFMSTIDSDTTAAFVDEIRKYNGIILKVKKLFKDHTDAVNFDYAPMAPSESPALIPGLHSHVIITVKPAFRK